MLFILFVMKWNLKQGSTARINTDGFGAHPQPSPSARGSGGEITPALTPLPPPNNLTHRQVEERLSGYICPSKWSGAICQISVSLRLKLALSTRIPQPRTAGPDKAPGMVLGPYHTLNCTRAFFGRKRIGETKTMIRSKLRGLCASPGQRRHSFCVPQWQGRHDSTKKKYGPAFSLSRLRKLLKWNFMKHEETVILLEAEWVSLPGRKKRSWYICKMQIKIIKHTCLISACTASWKMQVFLCTSPALFQASFKDKTSISGTFACVWDAEQSPLLVSSEDNWGHPWHRIWHCPQHISMWWSSERRHSK